MSMYNKLLFFSVNGLFGVTTDTCIMEECFNVGINPLAVIEQNSMEE